MMLLSWFMWLTLAQVFAMESKLQNIPSDVLQGIASCLYYKDRRWFLALSTQCRNAMQTIQEANDKTLDSLMQRVADISIMRFRSDLIEIKRMSQEMRRVGHARYLQFTIIHLLYKSYPHLQ